MKKLQCKKGYTITEMLCVLVVIALLTATMVTGVQFGVKYFAQTVARSEAKVLCSTLSAAVQDELRYARYVGGSGADFTYTSQKNGNKTKMSVNENGQVILSNSAGTKFLVGKGAYTYGTRAALNITYDKNSNVFTVKIEIQSKDNTVLEQSSFQVKRLNTGIE